jgi:hypothetical protein
MPRRPATHTQADFARAIRAMAQAGMRSAVEFRPDGTVAVVPVDGNVKPYSVTASPQVAKRKAPDL